MPSGAKHNSRSVRGRNRARATLLLVFSALLLFAIYLVYENLGTSATKGASTTTTSVQTIPPTSVATSTSTTQIDKGPYGVGVATYTLNEQGKYLCAPHGTSSGCVVRSMKLEVRYPVQGPVGQEAPNGSPYSPAGPYPLIVFGNGYLESVDSYSVLLDYWASRGYIVAAPQFPLSQQDSVGGPYEADILNQPGDLAAAINFMEAKGNQVSSRFNGIVSLHKIALIGQSDGGDAALAAGYNTCCQIGSVKAVISLSSAELSTYPGKYFVTPGPPLLVVQGTEDEINPPADSEMLYDQANVTKYYLTLLGADHLVGYVSQNAYSEVVQKVTTKFLDFYLKGSAEALNLMQSDGNVAGVASLK